jgi:protein tyrosine phosphatase (PTP) superfamily phosphohydrolase (DUF442 family)/rubrerythrin
MSAFLLLTATPSVAAPTCQNDTCAAAAGAHDLPTARTLEPYECGDVTRLHTFNSIFLASQPGVADFEQARMDGIRTVIDQRHASETMGFDERDVVTSLQMTYFNPAFNAPEELTDEIIDRTLHLLRTAERPILMHSSSGNRTGAIWLAYSVLDRGLAWEDAIVEAKTVGMRTRGYEHIIYEYVTRREGGSDSGSSASLDRRTEDALRAALDDERRAQAFYRAIMNEFGERRPFSAVINAERRHEEHLLALFATYELPAPANKWSAAGFEAPETFEQACRLAVEFELENVAMYDEFLSYISEDDILSTMSRLRRASLERHLPAFERWAAR